MELALCSEQGLAKPGSVSDMGRPVKGPTVGKATDKRHFVRDIWGQEHKTTLDTMRTGAPEQWTGTWAAPSCLPHTSDFWLSWRHLQGDIPPCLVLHPGETQPHRQHFQLEIITPSHPQ